MWQSLARSPASAFLPCLLFLPLSQMVLLRGWGLSCLLKIPAPARSRVRVEKGGPLNCRKNRGCRGGCWQLSFPEHRAFLLIVSHLIFTWTLQGMQNHTPFPDEELSVWKALTHCLRKPKGGRSRKFIRVQTGFFP